MRMRMRMVGRWLSTQLPPSSCGTAGAACCHVHMPVAPPSIAPHHQRSPCPALPHMPTVPVQPWPTTNPWGPKPWITHPQPSLHARPPQVERQPVTSPVQQGLADLGPQGLLLQVGDGLAAPAPNTHVHVQHKKVCRSGCWPGCPCRVDVEAGPRCAMVDHRRDSMRQATKQIILNQGPVSL